MKIHRHLLLTALLLLGSAHLAVAIGFAAGGAAFRAGAYRGYGYGYGVGLGYGYGYGYNPLIITTPAATPAPAKPAAKLRTALPAGAVPIVIFGQTYYFADGTYYRAQTSGGSTVYVVADP